MANVYVIGNVVRLTGAFTVAGVATAPTTVTITVRAPDGTLTTASGGALTTTGTGAYQYDYTPTQSGEHIYRIAGTGAAQAADEGVFVVKASGV